MLPDITLSVTVPHTLSLPDQVYVHQQSLHLNTKSSEMKITSTCFQLSNFDAYLQMRLAECDRTAKLKLKIKLNGHHLNTLGTFDLTVQFDSPFEIDLPIETNTSSPTRR